MSGGNFNYLYIKDTGDLFRSENVMSLVYKEVTTPPTPAKRETVVDAVRCDLCGALGLYSGLAETDWAPGSTVEETTIAIRTGDEWHGGGQSRTEFYDVCGSCFRDKVEPVLLQLGAVKRVSENDW